MGLANRNVQRTSVHCPLRREGLDTVGIGFAWRLQAALCKELPRTVPSGANGLKTLPSLNLVERHYTKVHFV
jgi:hypothetical protein